MNRLILCKNAAYWLVHPTHKIRLLSTIQARVHRCHARSDGTSRVGRKCAYFGNATTHSGSFINTWLNSSTLRYFPDEPRVNFRSIINPDCCCNPPSGDLFFSHLRAWEQPWLLLPQLTAESLALLYCCRLPTGERGEVVQ